MGNWSDRKTYQGKAVNLGLLYVIQAMNKILAHPKNGGETSPLTLVQGSWSGSVSASGGTHSGTGAMDITAWNAKNRERVGRILGQAMYIRETIPGVWSKHIHSITDGDGGAARAGLNQVKSYHNRRNALANNGPDTGYRMLVFPLFVFPEKPQGKPGKTWAREAVQTYEQPTSKSKMIDTIASGREFEVVAVVNVDGVYWGIDRACRCVPMAKLSRTKPTTGGGGTPTGKVPADVLDLTNWKYTKPDASEVLWPALGDYQNATSFRVGTHKGRTCVFFRADCNAGHTENSSYPRSETREMKKGTKGKTKADWSNKSGTHTFEGTFAFTHQPEKKPHTVCFQIHDDKDDVCMARLEGTHLFVESPYSEDLTLDSSYQLGEVFDLTCEATKNGIKITYENENGTKKTVTIKHTGSHWYFKYGCYTQATSRVKSSDKRYGKGYGEVAVLAARERHAA